MSCLPNILSRLLIAGSLIWLTMLPGHAAPALAPLPYTPAQGQFVMALAQDKQGNTWLGTEDNGLWRFDPHAPTAKQMTQFTAQSTNGGLGDDDIYSLCCDRLGRIWVGTLNHGVCVFNGKGWKDYDQLTGPLGCHVVALATSPVDGDIWGATEAGLFRYSLAHNTWTYYTRANGLPSDQATCLAFDKKGRLYVGTDCDGLAIGSPANDFRTWRTLPGPAHMPASPGGDGLPSSFINCLLVSKTGTVYAGTTTGLARSEDGGQSWRFLRGADWEAKVKGLYNGPAPTPTDTHGRLLLEDWVSALAQDPAGQLWVGYRSQDVEVINQDGARLYPLSAVPPFSEYVTCLLPRNDGSILEGKYGGGLGQLDSVTDTTNPDAAPPKIAIEASSPALPPTPFPKPAAPPSLVQLTAMLKRVQSLTTPLPVSEAAYLGSDWQTQGDWVGRYGRQLATLCAMSAPLDQQIGWWGGYRVKGQIGPHHAQGDSLRRWVTWAHTDNPKSLYSPVNGYRTQAEWDDHGEAYRPLGVYDGPDLWVTVTVPEGVHRVSLYDVNKDGHASDNRFRDFLVTLLPYRDEREDAAKLPPLAQARIRNFWGGVYESFLVKGPSRYYIRVAKNGSLNTILAGIFIDKLAGPPAIADQWPIGWMGDVRYEPPAPDQPQPVLDPSGSVWRGETHPTDVTQARALWASLDKARGHTADSALQFPYRMLAYRAAALGGSAALLADWRWTLHLWMPVDRQEFNEKMAQGLQSYLSHNPQLKNVSSH